MLKKILVTGATGFLGHVVVHELLKNTEFEVIAIGGRPEDKANTLPESPRLEFYSLEQLFTEQFCNVDTVINCAFARSSDTKLLSQSLDFTKKVIKRFETLKVKSVINISTQGVYKRLAPGFLSNEESEIEPIDLYSLAKYACEKMFELSSIKFICNVRLSSLIMPQRFLYFFIQKAIKGESFTVTTPNQYVSLMDVRDASSGILAIVKLPLENRAPIYNLGIGTQYSILDYASSVKIIGESLGYHPVFEVSDNGKNVNAGMDCSKLREDTKWKPKYYKEDMIKDLFQALTL